MRISGFQAVLAGLAVAWAIIFATLPAHAAAGAEPGIVEPVPDSDSRQPAEPPPAGFSAAQFIDSAGCVFVRIDGRWKGRVARDGSPVCGYPSTLSARRISPDAPVALSAEPAETPREQMARTLTEAIIPSLNEGELVSAKELPGTAAEVAATADGPGIESPRTAPSAGDASGAAEHAADVSPAAGADPLGIGAAMALAPALAAASNDRVRDRRLCALLGGAPAGGKSAALGRSAALGLCNAPAVTQLASAAPASAAAAGAAVHDQSGAVAHPARAKAVADIRAARTRKATKATRGPAVSTPAKARTARSAQSQGRIEAIIPPGARFVQIGSFADRANVSRNAARLGQMGLPVAASQGSDRSTAVLAGPFNDRGELVRAVDRLRRAGYRDAFAR